MWINQWLQDLMRDVSYALRGFGRSPGFAAIVVLTIALGVGANTAIFSVLYGTCLAPLSYPNPSRLVDVSMKRVAGHQFEAGTSVPNLRDWTTEASSFDGLAAHRSDLLVALSGGGEPREVHAWRISANAMALLGVPPMLGRWFTPDEDTASGPRSAIISYQLWRDRFSGESNVLGKTVLVDGEPFRIVGVMPNGFEFPPLMGTWKPILWLSLNVPTKMAADRSAHSLHVIGRLKPGVSIEQAQAEMKAITGELAKVYPSDNSEWPSATVSPLSDRYVKDFRSTLWLLLVAAGLVLLIACANVASLLVARGSMREREFAIRRALGVSTGRLIRQVLTESCVLAAIGCMFGVLFAFCSLPALKSMLEESPRVDEIALRPAVLIFAAGISLLTGILFGISPLVRIYSKLRAIRPTSGERHSQQRFRKVVMAVEIALSLLLLSAAGLMIESLWRATHVDLGFRTDHVLSMRFNLPERKYKTGQAIEAFRKGLLEHVSALPGVKFAGTNSAPPMGALSQHTDFEIEGTSEAQSASFANISPNYLRAMGIPLLRGRYFMPSDRRGSPLVVIVSQSVATRFFSGSEILGRRIRLGRSIAEWFTVIGVVGNIRQDGPESAPSSTIYALTSQLPESEQGSKAAHFVVLALRTVGSPANLAAVVRTVVAQIDKDQPAGDVVTLQELVDRELAGRRLNTLLIGIFAFLAVALAVIGMFGLVSYSVSRRTTEVGIRMALGAQRSRILFMIIRETLAFGLAGVIAGTLASFGALRFLSSRLYGSAPNAPYILLISASFIVATMVFATVLAARGLIALDPMMALRHD